MARLLGRTGDDRPVDSDAARRRLALLTTELGGSSGGDFASNGGGVGSRPDEGAGHAVPVRPLETAGRPGRHRAEPRSRSASSSVDGRSVTSQHVTVIALLLAVLMAAGSWWMLSGRPQARAVPPVSHSTVSPPSDDGAEPTVAADEGSLQSASGTSPSTGEESAVVVVDVAGRVARPGLVTLPAGARVADALKRAGGARPRVDLTSLNLARPLVDGEQLLVGVPVVGAPAMPGAAPSASPPSSPTATTLVNLNTATLEQLDTLPGVGPVTGQAILDWRAANGAFTSVDELLEVDGIGDATLSDLRDLVTV
jgi:competence protein ComEA